MDAASHRFPRAFVAGAALLGLTLRLAFGLLYWHDQPLTRDELEYLSLARSLAAGHGFVYDEVMRSGSFVPFGRAPGYPSFLAIIGAGRAVATSVPSVVKIAQAAVGASGVVLVALIAHRLAGARAARAASVIAAIYPPLTWIAAFAWSEAIFWPMGLFIAWLFDRTLGQRDRWLTAILCGVVVALGILTRPALLVFLPLAGLFLLWKWRPRMLVGLALGVAIVLGPWTVRNYREHGRIMIVASDGGVTFWTGDHPLAIGEGDMAANSALKQDNLRLRAQHPGLTEEAMERFYYEDAFRWMRAHPVSWLWLEVRKVFYLVVPIGPSYTLHSGRYVAVSVLSYLTLLAFAMIGFIRGRAQLAAAPALWILAGSAAMVCLIFFPQERFRFPIIDPALVVLAGIGAATIVPGTSRL